MDSATVAAGHLDVCLKIICSYPSSSVRSSRRRVRGATCRPLKLTRAHADLILFLEDGVQRGRPTRTDAEFVYSLFTITNIGATIAIPGKSAFLCRFELADGAGNGVPKTELGQQYGSRWTETQPMYDTKKDRLVSKIEARLINILKVDQGGSGFTLPALDKLFHIKNPGLYTARFDLEVFLLTGLRGNQFWQRVAFTAKFDVTKHPDEEGASSK